MREICDLGYARLGVPKNLSNLKNLIAILNAYEEYNLNDRIILNRHGYAYDRLGVKTLREHKVEESWRRLKKVHF